jgi:hypothetical protein
MVGYGDKSSGTRAVQALLPVVPDFGTLPTGSVYVPFRLRTHEGRFIPARADHDALDRLLKKIAALAARLGTVDAA